MSNGKWRETGLLNAADGLRQLILENPGLPLLVFAGEESNGGDYYWMACTSIKARLGEFLDCEQNVNEEYCYTDKDDFAEALEDQLFSDFKGSKEEFEEFLKAKLAEYEPYWKPCIILYVDN